MLGILGRPHAGAAAQIVLERYFTLHLICALLALGHLVGESLYLGRPLFRWSLSLLAALFVIGFIGGFGIQPKLHRLHLEMYNPKTSEDARPVAQRSFKIWHAVSQGLNLLAMVGVTVYLIRISRQGDNSRYRF
jgi:hypothetical protein